MKKRTFCLTMAAVLLFFNWVYGGNEFTDVSSEYWAHDSIVKARELGITDGYPDGSFRPKNTVTYAQFIKMAVNGNKSSSYSSEHWAAGSYYYALEQGYFTKNEIPIDDIDKTIPRAYMAMILGNIISSEPELYGYLPGIARIFDDVPSGYVYEQQIRICTDSGILSGYSDSKFGIGDSLTRAQAAAALVRLHDLKERNTAEKKDEAGSEYSYIYRAEGKTYYPGYGWVNRSYKYIDHIGWCETDSDPRSAEERMPQTQKSLLDEVSDSFILEGESGSYKFSYIQPQIPDDMMLEVKINIYDKSNVPLYSFSSTEGIMRSPELYDTGRHMVTGIITGVKSPSNAASYVTVKVLQKSTREYSVYQFVQEIGGGGTIIKSYNPALKPEQGSSQWNRIDKTNALSSIFKWK